MATLDWAVFGDDWGRHASTTQHLVANLPASDRVIWIDSLGMRSPRPRRADAVRIAGRLARALTTPPTSQATRLAAHLHPLFLPFHGSAVARRLNRALFSRAWRATLARLQAARPVALVANPLAAPYLDLIAPSRVVYLRLDDFAQLPGVDPQLVARFEPALLDRPPAGLADLVIAPNPRLLRAVPAPTLLLPQAVAPERFSSVPLEPPATRVIGYWGLVSPWLDQDLVVTAARRHPDWTFELRGPLGAEVARLRAVPNVHLLPPVPHAELAQAAAHWRAAWMPFRVDPRLDGLSPLKLREYLAAGFPTAATPHPEIRDLPVTSIDDLAALDRFLGDALDDTAPRRAARRASQADETWAARAATLRSAVLALPR